jgi:hypothetical protein
MENIVHNGKLDLGCGDNKREGFTGVDKYKTASTDAEVDLFVFPWPIADEVHMSHFFEHVPARTRPKFIEEIFRILKEPVRDGEQLVKEGGKATFITPMYDRMFQDFTHEWPPIIPGSYLYFNKIWREQNKLTHGEYDIKCNFDFVYGYSLNPTIQARNTEYQQFALQHYNNAASDLHVTLTKI